MVVKHGEDEVEPSLMPEMSYRMVKSVPIMKLAKVWGEPLGGEVWQHTQHTYIHT
jgi:hypothetical protein